MVCDINGLELGKGDVVAPVSGDMKGKVCGVKTEDGEGFVCIRAAHRPYSKGVWYASEHVQRLAIGKVRPRSNGKAEPEAESNTAGKASTAGRAASNGNGKAKTTAKAPARKGTGKTATTKSSAKSSAKRTGRRTVTTH